MSNKNCLLLHKDKYCTRIEVRCDSAQYADTIDCIMEILSRAAKERKVFVEYYGHNLDLECPNNVIDQKSDTKSPHRKILWVREVWLSVTDKSFVEENYTILYFFDSVYSWKDFLGCAGNSLHNMMKSPQLQLVASFGECQFPCLYLKHGNLAEAEILHCFKDKSFAFRHSIS